MSTAEIVNQLNELPEEKKQEASDFIAFLLAKSKADKQKADKESFTKVEGNPERGFGSLKGKIWMSPDFDEPLEDFKEYM
jgi:hypothetical protein